MHGLTQLMGLALERARDLQSNTLILYGELDEVIPRMPTAMMLQRLPKSAQNKQKVALYETGYHMLLRDLNAKVPRQDIIAWMNNPKQLLPSGADRRSLDHLLKGNTVNTAQEM